jgi:carboxypeptidase Q
MNRTLRTAISGFLVLTLSPALAIPQQSKSSTDVYAAIRKEGMDNSQIMKTLHVFTDVYGPRLTGSPQLKDAGEWAVKKMKGWGFDKAEMEPWDFGHSGWTNERASGLIVSPVKDTLVFEVLAWTPGTNGVVKANAVQIVLPDRPTQDELLDYFNWVKSQIKGKIVLVGKRAVIPVNFNPPAKRTDDEILKQRFDPVNPLPAPTPTPSPSPRPGQLSNASFNEQVDKFLVDNGALVRINDAGREHGQIRAFRSSTYDLKKSVPTIVLRNEDFGRISRLMENGRQVALEFVIRNRIYPEGKTAYNAVGEIKGIDKKDEIVIFGAHLDAWHSATGATDNAIGCAVMMEAGRILKAIGVQPRRTVRLALWSGEEQGILGSEAYIKRHFGTVESPLTDFYKLSGYINSDSGTGRPRGFTVFGPPEAAVPLREIATQFADYGMVGATTTVSRRRGGSDQSVFNLHGLPGIWTTIDPIEYGTHTWHTNLDTYERIIEDDAKKTAIVIAAAVYHLAMRDEMLPRFKPSEMPPRPPAPSPSPVPAPSPRARP